MQKEKTIPVDGKPVKLQIVRISNPADVVLTPEQTDTAGQERFRTVRRLIMRIVPQPHTYQLTSSYFRKANAMIIVYDITSKDSFDDLEGYIKEGTRYSDRSEKFIVGTSILPDASHRLVVHPLTAHRQQA